MKREKRMCRSEDKKGKKGVKQGKGGRRCVRKSKAEPEAQAFSAFLFLMLAIPFKKLMNQMPGTEIRPANMLPCIFPAFPECDLFDTYAFTIPARIFTNVNRQLFEHNEEGLFVTAWLGIKKNIDRFMGNMVQNDDITMVILKINTCKKTNEEKERERDNSCRGGGRNFCQYRAVFRNHERWNRGRPVCTH